MSRRPRRSAQVAVVVTVLVAIGVAVATHLLDFNPGVGNRRFHVALETSDATLLAFVAAVLLGRFRSDGSRRNLLMVTAVVLLAVKNLSHAMGVITIDTITGDDAIVWATAVNGLLGAALLAASAVLPDRRAKQPRRLAVVAVTGAMVTVLLVTLLAALVQPWLPTAFETLPDTVTELEILSGHPTKILVDFATAACYGVAAIAFARLSDRHDDELMRWLAISASIASVAFVNYALWPSRFSELVYGGEILWIGAIVVLLYGSVREIANLEAALVRTAVREERKRVARDLHDGVVQELAYIATHTRWLAQGPREPERAALTKILDAVERALDESRGAIAALNRDLDEPLDVAVGHAAGDVAERVGVQLNLHMASDVVVPDEWRDALIRIAREAVGNAARHGHAQQIDLQLTNGEYVTMRVSDDGEGFDTAAARSPQSFGLQSMRERTESLGGRFEITSQPGGGTTLSVVLP
jgi:signal transduction histidine kinase